MDLYSFQIQFIFRQARLRHMMPLYAIRVGEALGIARPQLLRCWEFVDGTFRFCCRLELF